MGASKNGLGVKKVKVKNKFTLNPADTLKYAQICPQHWSLGLPQDTKLSSPLHNENKISSTTKQCGRTLLFKLFSRFFSCQISL